MVALDQLEEAVALRRLARLTGDEDEGKIGGNLTLLDSLLNGGQQVAGGLIPAGGKPTDAINSRLPP